MRVGFSSWPIRTEQLGLATASVDPNAGPRVGLAPPPTTPTGTSVGLSPNVQPQIGVTAHGRYPAAMMATPGRAAAAQAAASDRASHRCRSPRSDPGRQGDRSASRRSKRHGWRQRRSGTRRRWKQASAALLTMRNLTRRRLIRRSSKNSRRAASPCRRPRRIPVTRRYRRSSAGAMRLPRPKPRCDWAARMWLDRPVWCQRRRRPPRNPTSSSARAEIAAAPPPRPTG